MRNIISNRRVFGPYLLQEPSLEPILNMLLVHTKSFSISSLRLFQMEHLHAFESSKETRYLNFVILDLRSRNVIYSALFSLNLQYSSQILKHLCDFPLPQCWFGYYSRLTAPKYAWLSIGEGEGQIKVRTKVSGGNVRNLDKIQDKWLLFQRFVTSIVELITSWKNTVGFLFPTDYTFTLCAEFRLLTHPTRVKRHR